MKFKRLTAIGRVVGFLILFSGFPWSVKAVSADAQLLGSTQYIVSAEQNSASNICPAQLPEAIDAIVDRPEHRRQHWGILIETLSPSRHLYSRNAQQYFIPASNVKLFTTAAALLQLGSDFRIRTSVYGKDGILRLVGRGDPSLTDAQLRDLAQQLRRQGIRQIQRLIVQDGYFQGLTLHPTWEWEDVYSDYAAPVNSLILNQNVVELQLSPQKLGQPVKITWNDPFAAWQWQIENQTLTAASGVKNDFEVNGILGKPSLQIRGQIAIDSPPEVLSLPVRDPGEHFLQHFKLALLQEGITVTQSQVTTSTEKVNEPELAFVESPPLFQMIADTNQPSNNLYAEALLRTLGVNNSSSTNQNTATLGLNSIKNSLINLGVDGESFVLADGSGLSRRNLVSPASVVQTLQAISQSPQAEIYRNSLPVAGVSGTLRNRFRETPAIGIIYAKTGTLTGVVTLSGYVDAPKYQRLIFSIMVNHSNQPARIIRQSIDEIVLLLTQLSRCE
ncbi:D-alanyl-D-alanine carboxypeptidase/D-alanyl-D-alanine-endopeptidase [Aerosakkonemataceae cyanobacterium BLCC-F154]|uniref:D-alanyl-D-alanine carboxypeptidase/D-alanyl-D-alanine-endopeptidase n=1 Tax=Floridaenema fluviatile BLCC-F154 TaxID=3153640 RepID=A0ABV4YIG6_9CYAN